MFIRNAWYIAAWADELGQKPLARRICNEPVVLFRDHEGRAAALVDRCCHRAAPLSHGELVPGGIQCGYHGLTFDGSGRCIEALRACAEGAAGRIHENRSQALAPAEDGIAHRLVQVLWRLVRGRKHAREHIVGARAPGDQFGRQLRGSASRRRGTRLAQGVSGLKSSASSGASGS